ncbi:MAG: 4Fe-4S binding protein [Candidatus Thermoplasmatota archaeon]|nr:4Fe-4S binding protein [Candidatus Thermoplasmatota archaeon]MDD5778529.1 4Fe-4S binding protein [Candidatus Thermoplasmatota archaeon]
MKKPLHVRLLETFFPLRFFLARLTRFAPLRKIINKLYFEHDDMVYVPRDTVIAVNRDVTPPESLVVPSRLVEHFVEEASHRWIMNFCICRDANQCWDYPQELGCLFLGEASQHIDPRLGRPASREEALEHLRKCREAGLVHLIGRNKLDAAWLKVEPEDRLMTICNCCPCCCLWLMLPHLDEEISSKVAKMPGVEVTVGPECTGCGTCVEVCFMGAITLEDGRAVIGADCRGCGRCAELCPQGAIEVSISQEALDRARDRIASRVDIS